MPKFKQYFILDAFELLIGTLALFTSALTIISFYRMKFHIVVVVGLFLIGLGVIFIFLKLLKIYKVANRRLKEFSVGLHQFSHSLRNEFYSLENRKERHALTKELLTSSLLTIGQHATDIISTILSISTGEDISVNIKYFSIDKNIRVDRLSEKSIENLTLKILCRSKNSHPDRPDDNEYRIKDNTDLSDIIIGHKKHFAERDLSAFSKALEKASNFPYKDTNTIWKKFFNTKITVPIQIDKSYKNKAVSSFSYDILGFITVDSISNSTFPKDEMYFYVNLLKGFADSLYKYFDRFVIYWEELDKKEGA